MYNFFFNLCFFPSLIALRASLYKIVGLLFVFTDNLYLYKNLYLNFQLEIFNYFSQPLLCFGNVRILYIAIYIVFRYICKFLPKNKMPSRNV